MNNFTLNIWLKRLEKSCRTDLPILVFHVRIHVDTAPKVCYTLDLGSWAEPGKKNGRQSKHSPIAALC